jgi:hypothetical protein
MKFGKRLVTSGPSVWEKIALFPNYRADLEEKPVINIPETALLSETSLAEDWNRPEEDAAWSCFQ